MWPENLSDPDSGEEEYVITWSSRALTQAERQVHTVKGIAKILPGYGVK